MEHIEHLSKQIRDLHVRDDDFNDEDLLLMDYATDIARTLPSLLEGTYQQRLNTVKELARSSEEVLRKKSWRLAGLQPSANDPLSNGED